MIELIEIEPGKWRVYRPTLQRARSDLPRPYVISDTMEPTEQVDGRFYSSKRAYRAVGRRLGLTEVGNEKPKPKTRASAARETRDARQQAIRRALQRVGG